MEVTLALREDFLKVKETLTRIGVASKRENTLYQSCHILHKRDRYSIMHFKELFVMDGKEATLTEDDVGRRNTIVRLLSEWKLVRIIDPDRCASPFAGMQHIKVIPYAEKGDWLLVPKYQIGVKR